MCAAVDACRFWYMHVFLMHQHLPFHVQDIRMSLSDDPAELLHQLKTIEKILLVCSGPNKAFNGQHLKEVQQEGTELQQVALKKVSSCPIFPDYLATVDYPMGL